jgi:hypothetical protein
MNSKKKTSSPIQQPKPNQVPQQAPINMSNANVQMFMNMQSNQVPPMPQQMQMPVQQMQMPMPQMQSNIAPQMQSNFTPQMQMQNNYVPQMQAQNSYAPQRRNVSGGMYGARTTQQPQ